MTELMHGRFDERDPHVGAVEAPSPFRSAFARARVEARGAGDPAPSATVRPDSNPGYEPPASHLEVARLPVDVFEVRIEKRRGRRADEARWCMLGVEGWELVSVVGKRAFFRRRSY